MHALQPLTRLHPSTFETATLLKRTATASRKPAEVKGLAASIPNQAILINALALQEAKDSSAIENIVTTHDEPFRGADLVTSPAAKEVRDHVQALRVGHDMVQRTGLLTSNHMVAIRSELEHDDAGFRRLPGSALKNQDGAVVYTPPQDPAQIVELMQDPERFVNVLYLVNKGLLDIPVLHLSSAIVRSKSDYYRLLQAAREHDDAAEPWQDWVLYMLAAVETTAQQALATITDIQAALLAAKHRIRAAFRFDSQDLINNLFMHPYTRIESVERDLKVSRLTATKCLDALAAEGLLRKMKVGRSNCDVNVALNPILTRAGAG